MKIYSKLAASFLFATLALSLEQRSAEARYTGSQPVCVSGVASHDRLNVRNGPGASYSRVGSFAPGQCGMNVEAVQGNWTYLRGSSQGRNLEGWVNNRFLARADGGGDHVDRYECVVNVAYNDVLNIRSSRSGSSPIVGAIPPGQCGVRVMGRRGAWKRVEYRGVVGWSAGRYLR